MNTPTFIRRLVLGASVGLVGAVAFASDQPAASPASPAGSRPPSFQLSEQKAAMAKLQWMAGDWQGQGWINMGGQRVDFRGGEHVQVKLGGVALLVEGNFVSRDASGNESPSHVTLGVISYDPRRQQYRFRSWLASGASGDAELHVTDSGWWWEVVFPGGRMRYTATVTDGDWVEVGERTMEGGEPQTFFEMRLRRG